jgi:DNA repair exonuclease SbcCD ATPase subunit
MVNIEVKELRFSNFFQYGSNINTFKFKNGMTWLKADNGVGKSTIIDAISMAFFNKAYRKISLSDFINSKNNEDAKIDLEFDRITTSGERVEYLISRRVSTKETSKLTIFKGDDEISKKAGVNQKYLEEEILGFNKVVFDNVICLDALAFNFLETSPEQKRKLIESVISLDVSKIKKRNSKEITKTNTDLKVSQSNSQLYKSKISELTGIVDQLELDKTKRIHELKDESDRITKELVGLNELLIEKDKEIDEITRKGKSLSEELQQYANIENDINELNGFSSITTKIESYDESIKKLKLEINENTSKLSDIELLIKSLDESKISFENELGKYTNRNPNIELAKINAAIDNCNRQMEECISKNDNIQLECPTCKREIDTEKVESIRNSYREEYKKYRDSLNDWKTELDTTLLDINKYDQYNSLLTQINTETANKNSIVNGINKSNNDINEYEKLKIDELVKLESIKSKYDVSKIAEIISELNTKLEYKNKLNSDIADLRQVLVEMKSKRDLEVFSVITSNNSKLLEIKTEIDKINDPSTDDALEKAKSNLVSAQTAYDDSMNKILEDSDKLIILDHIADLCSDDGVKKDTIKDFIPMLNYQIMKFLRVFNQPYTIEFTDSLDYNFISDMGSAKVYHGLSAGQKSRVNFSISIAFRAFVSQIADFDINVMFLDEFLDKSTDNSGIVNMAKILKQNVDEFGSLCVMTHKGDELVEEWDNIITIENDGVYSTILPH